MAKLMNMAGFIMLTADMTCRLFVFFLVDLFTNLLLDDYKFVMKTQL